jgi:hypothetical protein
MRNFVVFLGVFFPRHVYTTIAFHNGYGYACAYGILCTWGYILLLNKTQIMRLVNQLFIGYHEKKGRYVMEGCFGRSG